MEINVKQAGSCWFSVGKQTQIILTTYKSNREIQLLFVWVGGENGKSLCKNIWFDKVLTACFPLNCHYIYVSLLWQKEREKWTCMFDIVWTERLERRNKVFEEKMCLYSSAAGFVASEGRAFTNGFPGEERRRLGATYKMVIRKIRTIGTKGICLCFPFAPASLFTVGGLGRVKSKQASFWDFVLFPP